MRTLTARLEGLEGLIQVLAKQSEERRKLMEEKKAIVQQLVGLPYYWDLYSGSLEASTDPTCLIAHVIHQKTGAESYWKLDAHHLYEHLLTYQECTSWEEYYQKKLIKSAEDYETTMIRFGFSLERLEKEMMSFCEKFQIPYKSYLIWS